MGTTWAIVAGLVPSIGLGLALWVALRAIVRGDRNERAAQAALDAAEAKRQGTEA